MLNPRMLLISAPELSVGAVGLCCLLNVSITHFDSHIHSPIYLLYLSFLYPHMGLLRELLIMLPYYRQNLLIAYLAMPIQCLSNNNSVAYTN